MSTSQETLQQAFEQQRSYFPVPVTAEQESLLIRYLDCVLETNQSLNLTAITEPEEMIRLHVLDSLMVLPGLDQRLQSSQQKPELLDLGTGAGFPGMPLQILRPNWSMTLLDALDKRIQFIRRAGGQVGIPGDWRALHGRGEELGKTWTIERDTRWYWLVRFPRCRFYRNYPCLLFRWAAFSAP